ncbi:Crp/Fnr family transcriptional regulator [endosymbiont of unidentified scaly snail isolate Monju]|uniref:Crp/Fnr family transcriptional regulator n=1 Tax=endosymbiont of unidentified scaly snail isolate Monju TaxID=1248727 RepID=UPI0003891D14|nr:Crp/Fnr family transcriptional regulator [endosymbiont of unidentified scaly snail isolate Monju]BAN69456.1 CRP/FNR family transcriptional regulator [endosymbiont of unidentified scaly snail isolate Monju]
MKALLKRGPLFAALSDDQLDRITQHARQIRLESGEALFEQGEPAERFYLVTSGQIKLFRLSPNGNEKVVEIVTPGCTFAEALMFLQHPTYPVSAQALTSAEVISVDARDFTVMLHESTETCFLLLGDLSQRIRGLLLREIDELSLYSATCRVAGYLAEAGPPDRDEFELPVAKQILASRLSVKPETFSRHHQEPERARRGDGQEQPGHHPRPPAPARSGQYLRAAAGNAASQFPLSLRSLAQAARRLRFGPGTGLLPVGAASSPRTFGPGPGLLQTCGSGVPAANIRPRDGPPAVATASLPRIATIQ